jgi:hypothetical protein
LLFAGTDDVGKIKVVAKDGQVGFVQRSSTRHSPYSPMVGKTHYCYSLSLVLSSIHHAGFVLRGNLRNWFCRLCLGGRPTTLFWMNLLKTESPMSLPQ